MQELKKIIEILGFKYVVSTRQIKNQSGRVVGYYFPWEIVENMIEDMYYMYTSGPHYKDSNGDLIVGIGGKNFPWPQGMEPEEKKFEGHPDEFKVKQTCIAKNSKTNKRTFISEPKIFFVNIPGHEKMSKKEFLRQVDRKITIEEGIIPSFVAKKPKLQDFKKSVIFFYFYQNKEVKFNSSFDLCSFLEINKLEYEKTKLRIEFFGNARVLELAGLSREYLFDLDYIYGLATSINGFQMQGQKQLFIEIIWYNGPNAEITFPWGEKLRIKLKKREKEIIGIKFSLFFIMPKLQEELEDWLKHKIEKKIDQILNNDTKSSWKTD